MMSVRGREEAFKEDCKKKTVLTFFFLPLLAFNFKPTTMLLSLASNPLFLAKRRSSVAAAAPVARKAAPGAVICRGSASAAAAAGSSSSAASSLATRPPKGEASLAPSLLAPSLLAPPPSPSLHQSQAFPFSPTLKRRGCSPRWPLASLCSRRRPGTRGRSCFSRPWPRRTRFPFSPSLPLSP